MASCSGIICSSGQEIVIDFEQTFYIFVCCHFMNKRIFFFYFTVRFHYVHVELVLCCYWLDTVMLRFFLVL